jgi:signal transduction histidine kinase
MQTGILGPVIDALATAETTLIGRDPDLPVRRGRGPRLAAVDPSPAERPLIERIRDLEHQVRVRAEHIAIVAHDLRSPMTPVLLLVRRLLEDLGDAGDATVPARGLQPKVDAISRRLDQFVTRLHQLLDATRLQTNELELEPEPIDLPTLARQVVAELGTDPSIRITGVDALPGTWDRARIEEILRNLLANAIRFGAGKPIELEIGAVDDPDLAVIVVRDHGIGIAAADQHRIFDKHVRVSRAPGGFGLGLWIVRQLCDAMGGRVGVQSAPGEGAAFTVSLPRLTGRRGA